jgi:hypothetical protein
MTGCYTCTLCPAAPDLAAAAEMDIFNSRILLHMHPLKMSDKNDR